ncbi:efflux RND transporter periplasmic adaptor subunit [Limnovirga soli]|uniref:Efflux RND transporter periplasmic adaptor subunit n=1 Tax=Limnovirga soli TaxID=2656915 RepID=A0A8J8FCI1_9BACT|nr:efflux RND transporter periplasmic adaptor subunit [Limnovirga soli]NNV55210.1 efflux RND transporter periplasmic adaptor subunit [Limnovirga soli]
MKKILIYISAAILIVSCNNSADETVDATQQKLPGNTVTFDSAQLKNAGIQTDTASLQILHATIKANGTVDVPPQSMVSVSFPLGGYLKSTSLLPGAEVRKGQVLGIMEDQAYVQLQQDYLTAKAKMEYLKADVERQKELTDAEAASKKNYQLVLSDFKTQQILIRALEEKLKIIGIEPGSLNVNNISRDVAIHAPINGFVSKVNVNIGKYVNPADVLFELINPSDIHAAITVFEKDIAAFKAGMQGTVTLADEPGKAYKVEVILVTRNLDENRAGMVHCHFLTPQHNLLPGMFLTGSFELDNKAAQTIPEEAVLRYEGKEFVFLTKDGSTFTMKEVKTGAKENGFVELLPDDSTSWIDNRIVVKGAYSILGMLKNKLE